MFILGIVFLSLAGFCLLFLLFIGMMGWATGNGGLNSIIPIMLVVGLLVSGLIIVDNATNNECNNRTEHFETVLESNTEYLDVREFAGYIMECVD